MGLNKSAVILRILTPLTWAGGDPLHPLSNLCSDRESTGYQLTGTIRLLGPTVWFRRNDMACCYSAAVVDMSDFRDVCFGMATFRNTTNMLPSSAVFVTVFVFVVVLEPLTRACCCSGFSVISNSRRAAVVISGTELARQIQREIQRDVEELVAQGNMRPHLGVVLVGEDPASRTYVKNKTRAASILGKFALPECKMCTS